MSGNTGGCGETGCVCRDRSMWVEKRLCCEGRDGGSVKGERGICIYLCVCREIDGGREMGLCGKVCVEMWLCVCCMCVYRETEV